MALYSIFIAASRWQFFETEKKVIEFFTVDEFVL
jgi:hypothetical protein